MSEVTKEINSLRKEKNAVILAHFYQSKEIQEIADYVGDSLGLSQNAAETQADIIVFAGVHFMAETAKILNPTKKVLLPDINAGCSLAFSCPPDKFKEFIARYPNHTVVTYVNCSAEIKAMSDIICTSSNVERIINSLPINEKIIFAPDKNLGRYIQAKTGRDFVLWDGACIVHEAFSIGKLLDLYAKNPNAKIIAHPESEEHILDVSSFIGSTSQMINYVKTNPHGEFIVATEAGILHKMQMAAPMAKLIPAPSKENNTCACSECAFMRVNTLEKLRDCLKNEQPEVIVNDEIRKAASLPIQRMLELSQHEN